MEHSTSIAAISGVIQLAVAPVFLLAGIAGILNVMSIRLGRIVDRARVIERRIPGAGSEERQALLQRETSSLWRRIRLITGSIGAGITAALLVCLVVVALFLGEFAGVNLYRAIGVLFVLAMVLMIVGLVLLLSELTLSARWMRQGIDLAVAEREPEGGDN